MRGTKAKADANHAKRMREQGYRDGYSGKPARWSDAIYQASWRRGREGRRQDESEVAS